MIKERKIECLLHWSLYKVKYMGNESPWEKDKKEEKKKKNNKKYRRKNKERKKNVKIINKNTTNTMAKQSEWWTVAVETNAMTARTVYWDYCCCRSWSAFLLHRALAAVTNEWYNIATQSSQQFSWFFHIEPSGCDYFLHTQFSTIFYVIFFFWSNVLFFLPFFQPFIRIGFFCIKGLKLLLFSQTFSRLSYFYNSRFVNVLNSILSESSEIGAFFREKKKSFFFFKIFRTFFFFYKFHGKPNRNRGFNLN